MTWIESHGTWKQRGGSKSQPGNTKKMDNSSGSSWHLLNVAARCAKCFMSFLEKTIPKLSLEGGLGVCQVEEGQVFQNWE